MIPKDRTFLVSGGCVFYQLLHFTLTFTPIPSSPSGLGLATVKALHQVGAYVAVLDLQDIPQDVKDSCGSKVRFFKTDLTNAAEVEKTVQNVVGWVTSTKATLGGVVNCAGVASAAKVFPFCGLRNANCTTLTSNGRAT
jgi:short-subunit dehydrogenase involved in D-alanine esterification of teichoic acids